MASNKIDMAKIVESWGPVVKAMTKNAINESSPRYEWLCEYAHNHMSALNEDTVIQGTGFPMQNLFNVNGIGNAVPASFAGQTASDQMNPNSFGSGDKWPALLPMALQVGGRTIGFDLVNSIPTPGPTYVLPFMDYVYAGSKNPYGATPGHNGDTANPQYAPGDTSNKAYLYYEAPHAFRTNLGKCVKTTDPSATVAKNIVIKGMMDAGIITIGSGDTAINTQCFGITRLSAEPMFKVMQDSKLKSLGGAFGADASVTIKISCKDEDGTTFDASVNLCNPRLISALEDHILGFTGAGKYDTDRWSSTYQDPLHLYEPMDRGTGEAHYARQMNLNVFTRFGQVGTMDIAVGTSQEQIQDLQKQWGIDVLKLVENAAINELSQSINKHILSRLFALGWRNHVHAYKAEGINLNLNITQDISNTTVFFATYDERGTVTADSTTDRQDEYRMPVNDLAMYGTFENNDTVYKRIYTKMLEAGNIIMQRGRRGPATFAVTNAKVATILQTNAQYGFAPIANTVNQTNGSLYPVGTMGGITIYVDPMMSYYDTRILVGRKGGKEEPGVIFCPYIMAESIKLITEQTGSPKVIVKSRYALVDMGWYPELNYITFYVRCPENI